MKTLLALLLVSLAACDTMPTVPVQTQSAHSVVGTYSLQSIGVHPLPFDGVTSDVIVIADGGTWTESRNGAAYQAGTWTLVGPSLTLTAGTTVAYGGAVQGAGLMLLHGTFAYTFVQ
jgi:hypothetical protein